jgi:AbrB family looped-hinge helix DNA binding protein
MGYVQVKSRFQVTLPKNLRKEIGLKEGDLLDARAEAGAIILVPQKTSRRRSSRAKPSPQQLMRYFGAGRGLFDSPEDVDAFIRREREAWSDTKE